MNWNDPAPGEEIAGERSWEVVRAAWKEREPVTHREPRRRWPLVALAAAAAVVAATVTPPGRAVLGSLRDAVGTSEDHVLSLPASGQILVNTPGGAWIVHADGSKRFLSGYADAAWSPHALYVAAARRNTLVAMEPNGTVHWKLARRGPIGAPQWSFEGFRIAYLARAELRIVNGDGTGDRRLSANAVGTGLPAYAWRPATHQLAYRTATDRVASPVGCHAKSEGSNYGGRFVARLDRRPVRAHSM